ncbi:SHC-transforming protein 2 [Stegostoma tigrinum]|uniref:SHC-transforming protein 2 n=1 Tax=Stegostoma tigrinum TaxID=3053191 RepID=UPI00202B65E0|nr:SHC-transforming protein 2 [Stegostoma tigrinum]XP_048415586.1 SHC-transforming protein 2 [Stegostoma tigrinum]XP_048415587.1 SHC-transforming protein 2 [Stegostoma tigrinum]
MKPKYGRFRSESVTSSASGLFHSLTMSGQLGAAPVAEEPEDSTTFCTLIPRIPHWKFSASPGGRNPAKGLPPPPGPGLATVLGSCDSLCPPPCSVQATARLPGGGRRVRVEGVRLAGGEWNRKGSFINKPSGGWLHPDTKILGPGVSYIVRYMGCIEVVKSMRSLDFNTRTQVTREAINRLHETVPGVKGTWKRKPSNPSLQSILGRSNLRFAGMSITINISIEGLNLALPTTRQIIANHHMQSISFASGGDTDTTDYVAYVAKDPVNQRACHILECCEGLAQTVISTIGQAFELRFKQYLHSPPKVVAPLDRMNGSEESAWGEEEEEMSEHNYYNSIPGKQPPLGGIVDTRSRQWNIPAQLPCPAGTIQLSHITESETDQHKEENTSGHCEDLGQPMAGVLNDGYLRPYGRSTCGEHMYVNTQALDLQDWTGRDMSITVNGAVGDRMESPEKDMFDMRPFDDALKLHDAKSRKCKGTGIPCLSPSSARATEEEQLKRESWYHGKISRKVAEKLLVLDGDFLVRESMTNRGQYVLTGMHNGQAKHLLLVDPEGVVRTKDLLFENITHLINYHFESEVPIVAAESEVCLKQIIVKRKH